MIYLIAYVNMNYVFFHSYSYFYIDLCVYVMFHIIWAEYLYVYKRSSMTSIMLSRLNYNMLYTASHLAVKQQFITKMSMLSTTSVKVSSPNIYFTIVTIIVYIVEIDWSQWVWQTRCQNIEREQAGSYGQFQKLPPVRSH